MKLLFTLLSLSIIYISSAQKSPIGLLIDFTDNCSYEAEQQLISQIADFEPDKKEMQLTGFGVHLALFNRELNASEITAIQNQLEENDLITYTSLLFQSNEGAIAADLPEIFIRPKKNWLDENTKDFIHEYQFDDITPYSGSTNTWKVTYDKTFQGSINSLITDLKASGEFDFVCQNMLYTLRSTTNDPFLGNQWALDNDGSATQYNGTAGADMEVTAAWGMNTGENYIKVAVLDSGTDTNHVDLVGNLLPGFDGTGGGSKGYPNTNYSNDGHGTCTAGIIAARGDNAVGIAGVAYDCKVIPIKIFYYVNIGAGVQPFTTSSAGTDGIIWAVDTAKADILSNSWGLRDSDIATLGIDTSMGNSVISQKIASGRYGKGVPMLFSSGNEGDPFSIWPASHPQTISVGASTMCDELKTPTDCSPENWWGSNHGTALDVTAPGVKVLATDMTGALGYNGFSDNDYTEFNGTSAACPNAAGVMALILSEDSTLTELEAREILSKTAEQVGGYLYDQAMDFGWWSDEMGYGRVNALKALQYMNSTASIEEENALHIFYENGRPILLNNELKTFEVYDTRGALVTAFESDLNEIYLDQFVPAGGLYLLKTSGQSNQPVGIRFLIK